MSLLILIFLISSTGLSEVKPLADSDSLEVGTSGETTSGENVHEYTFGNDVYSIGFNRSSISTNTPEERINISGGTLELKIKLLSLPMRGGKEFPLYITYRGSPLSFPEVRFSVVGGGEIYGNELNWEQLSQDDFLVTGDIGNCGLGWDIMPGEVSVSPKTPGGHPCSIDGRTVRTGYVNINSSKYDILAYQEDRYTTSILTWYVKGRQDCYLNVMDYQGAYTDGSECHFYTPEYSYFLGGAKEFIAEFYTSVNPSNRRRLFMLNEMRDRNGNYLRVSWWNEPGLDGGGDVGSFFLTSPPAQRIPDSIITPTDTCYIYRKTIIPEVNEGKDPLEVYCPWKFYVIDSVAKDINGEHFVVNLHYHQEWYYDVMEYWYGHQFILLDSIEFLKDGERIKPPYKFEYSGKGELISFTSPDGAEYSYTYTTTSHTAPAHDIEGNYIGDAITKYKRIIYKTVELPEQDRILNYQYNYGGSLNESSVGPMCTKALGGCYAPDFPPQTYYPIYKQCDVLEMWSGGGTTKYRFLDSAWVDNHLEVKDRAETFWNITDYILHILPNEKEEFYGKPLKTIKIEGGGGGGPKELTQFNWVLGDKITPHRRGILPLHPVLKYKFVQNNPDDENLDAGEKVKLYHYKEFDEYDNVKKQEFLGYVDYIEETETFNQILTFGIPGDDEYQEWENKNLPSYTDGDISDNWEVRKSYLYEQNDDYEDSTLCLYHLEDTVEKFKKTGPSSWELVSKAEFEYDNPSYLLNIEPEPILHGDSYWWYWEEYDLDFTTRGNLTKKTEYINEDENRFQEYWYDICGNLLKMKDYMGNEYEYDYGPAYVFPDIIEYPDGSIDDFDFDRKGNLRSFTDKSGIMDRFDYDVYGRLTEYRRGIPGELSLLEEYQYYDFERWARVYSQVSAGAYADVTYYYYDELGRLEESRRVFPYDGEIKKEFFYDRKGNLNKETVPRFSDAVTVDTVKKKFDVLGRVTEIEYPKSSIEAGREYVTYEYDGDITGVRDEEDNYTTLINDASGNLVKLIDALYLNDTTYYDYDVNGNLLKIIDAEEKEIDFEYDWLGNLVRREGPDRGVDIFEYDVNGNTKYHKLNSGDEIEFEYDELNRIEIKRVNNQVKETYYYDDYDNIVWGSYDPPGVLDYPEGRLIGFQNPNVREVYFYDSLGRMAQKKVISLTDSPEELDFEYTYDLKGRVTKLQYGDVYKVEYDYDHFDNISSVEINDGETVTFSSTAVGLLSTVDFPGGVTDAFTYKPRNWMESLHIEGVPDPDYENYREFIYNKRGELTEVQWGDPLTTYLYYQYDALGRLKHEHRYDTDTDHDFTYDKVGNRDVVDGITYQYIAHTNKLTDDGPNTYAYNDIGCISSKSNLVDGTTNFTYDAEGKLVGVELPDGENGYKYYYKGHQRIREEKLSGIEHTQTLEGVLYSCKLKWATLPGGVLEAVFLDNNGDEIGTETLVSSTVIHGTHDWIEFSGTIAQEILLPGTASVKLRVKRVDGSDGHLWVGDMSIDLLWEDGGISGDVEKPSDYFYDNAGNLILVNSFGNTESINVVKNPSFESGSSNWSITNWSITNQYSQEGEYSLLVYFDSDPAYAYQEIPISETVSSPITISCWIRANFNYGGGFELRGVLKGDGVNEEYSSGVITESSIGYFTQVSLTIDSIPEGTSSCEIGLIKTSGYAAVIVDNVVCELETEQEISTKYIYAGKRLLAKEEDGELFFYHLDRLGSPIMITDESGAVVKEKKYEAFGNLVWAEGDYEDNREFTSKEKDPTGFHYFGARYYSGDIGRFLTPDPAILYPQLLDLAHPLALHPYAYCHNDPLNFIDPWGLFEEPEVWMPGEGVTVIGRRPFDAFTWWSNYQFFNQSYSSSMLSPAPMDNTRVCYGRREGVSALKLLLADMIGEGADWSKNSLIDFNKGYGNLNVAVVSHYLLGGTAGVLKDQEGWHIELGLITGNPGASVGLTRSTSAVTSGFHSAAQVMANNVTLQAGTYLRDGSTWGEGGVGVNIGTGGPSYSAWGGVIWVSPAIHMPDMRGERDPGFGSSGW